MLNSPKGILHNPKNSTWVNVLFSIGEFQVSGAIITGFIGPDDVEVLGLAGVETL